MTQLARAPSRIRPSRRSASMSIRNALSTVGPPPRRPLPNPPILADRIGRLDEHRDTRGCGQQLAQEFQPLCCQLGRENTDAGEVATRPGEARNKTNADRVITGYEDDWDCRRCRLGCEYGRCTDRSDHGNLSANQIGRQLRQSIKLVLGPAVDDRDVLALDITGLFQALAKCA